MNTKDLMLPRNSGTSPVKLLLDKSLFQNDFYIINKSEFIPIHKAIFVPPINSIHTYRVSSCVRF